MVFDKIYVINVDRNIHKFNRVKNRLKKTLGDVEIERIQAVDREELTEAWLNEKGVTPSPLWKEPWGNRTFTKGDIACALSHMKAWEKIILDGTKVALLLEDDVVFEEDFVEGCQNIENEIKAFDYIYLARNLISDEFLDLPVSEHLVRPSYNYWCLASLISSSGAKKLRCQDYVKNLIPSDEYVPARVSHDYAAPVADKLFNHLEKLDSYAYIHNIAIPEEMAWINSETAKGEPMELESKHNYINNDLKLKIVTTATEDTDGLKRLRESASRYGIPLKVLGLEKSWTGGEVARLEDPGGGQKINLLKPYLQELDDDDILVFVDGYDVVFTRDIESALEAFNNNFPKDVVFSAEKACWPDSGLTNSYPKVDSEYRFLNSGTFIGKVSELKKITEEEILDTDDDQLYYTKKLLSGRYSMQLDYSCSIFQTIEAAWDDIKYIHNKYDGRGDLINEVFDTRPIMVHGNGSVRSKIFFNRVCDYISCNRLGHFKYNPIKIKKYDKNLTLSIFMFITDGREFENFIKGFYNSNHNRDDISIFICGMNIKISDICLDMLNSFKSFKVREAHPDNSEMENALLYAKELDCDYTIMVNSNCIINNENIIQRLIESNKKIIAPKLKSQGDNPYANFWRDIDDNGWYLQTQDYLHIAFDKITGVWNCPHISDFILIRKDFVKDCISKFTNGYTHERGDYMTFCKNLRNSGDFVYIDNQEYYGYLIVD
jgi:GR25 family glycosyltransferase involved in LPS biosynthesis